MDARTDLHSIDSSSIEWKMSRAHSNRSADRDVFTLLLSPWRRHLARFSAGPAPSGNGDRPPGCLTFGKLRAWLSDWYDHAFAVGYIHPNDSALHERIGALHVRSAETIARKNDEVDQ
ncbi:hypothetical protein OKW45_007435 [Paraburkholderia sp. WSM4175]|uniref:hypothetical protein n=1 Tax=Paraburkholderia sp. WSM4175 TaxID=2991072 RepID=UPI003D22C83D